MEVDSGADAQGRASDFISLLRKGSVDTVIESCLQHELTCPNAEPENYRFLLAAYLIKVSCIQLYLGFVNLPVLFL